MSKARIPNLYIIGAAKSATTSLADFLRGFTHLCYCPNNKEPNHFVFEAGHLAIDNLAGPASSEELKRSLHPLSIVDRRQYLDLYNNASQKWLIDASVRYLYYEQCAYQIKKNSCSTQPPRFIACLRKPSQRARSHYLMMKHRYRLEPLSFEQAIAEEEERKQNSWDYDWHYLSCGRYYEQLNPYVETFGIESIHIIIFEELISRPAVEIYRLMRFLDAPITDVVHAFLSPLPCSNKKSEDHDLDYACDARLSNILKDLDADQKEKIASLAPSVKVPW